MGHGRVGGGKIRTAEYDETRRCCYDDLLGLFICPGDIWNRRRQRRDVYLPQRSNRFIKAARINTCINEL